MYLEPALTKPLPTNSRESIQAQETAWDQRREAAMSLDPSQKYPVFWVCKAELGTDFFMRCLVLFSRYFWSSWFQKLDLSQSLQPCLLAVHFQVSWHRERVLETALQKLINHDAIPACSSHLLSLHLFFKVLRRSLSVYVLNARIWI